VEKVIDTVGSGDSFLAGFVLNYIKNIDLENCFKCAIACGAANTLVPGPGIFFKKDVEKLLKKVEITKIA
jgi:fructose-1-phosphate kinase PfkB-like protein